MYFRFTNRNIINSKKNKGNRQQHLCVLCYRMQKCNATRVKCEMFVYHEVGAQSWFQLLVFPDEEFQYNQMQVWHTAVGVLGKRVHLGNLWLIRGVCGGRTPDGAPCVLGPWPFGCLGYRKHLTKPDLRAPTCTARPQHPFPPHLFYLIQRRV